MNGEEFRMNEQARFMEKFHWLKEIPENILETIDYSEFFDPDIDLLSLVQAINCEYDVNVMVYNKASDGIPEEGKRHLCTIIKSASIPTSVLKKISEIERYYSNDNIIVVCYRKPVEMRVNRSNLIAG